MRAAFIALRTAAAGALAASVLGPVAKDITCIGVIGSGVQARFQLRVLKAVLGDIVPKVTLIQFFPAWLFYNQQLKCLLRAGSHMRGKESRTSARMRRIRSEILCGRIHDARPC